MDSLIGLEIGRYQIQRQIAEHSLAVVYQVFDTSLEQKAVLKLARGEKLNPVKRMEMFERFEFAAKVQMKLVHSFIMRIYDTAEYQGTPYLVMDYAEKGSLKERLGFPQPYTAVSRLLAPAALALMYAQQNGVLHGNLKPSNILLKADNRPMVSDFGLSGADLGSDTIEYLAAELWDEGPTAQSDIYALGIIFFELVTGQRAYTPPPDDSLDMRPTPKPLPDPRQFVPGLPIDVQRVVAKATSPYPFLRYKNMNEFAAELHELGVSDSPTLRQAAAPVRPAPKPVQPPLVVHAVPFSPPPRSLLDQVKSRLGGGQSAAAQPEIKISDVDFTLTAPQMVPPGYNFTLETWARVRRKTGALGPLAEPAGRTRALQVLLNLPGFTLDRKVDTLNWQGRAGKLNFAVQAPAARETKNYDGWVSIHLNGLLIARYDFILEVGSHSSPRPAPLPVKVFWPRSAYACYGSADQTEALRRAWGIRAVHPGLEVFLGAEGLRAMAEWEERAEKEISRCDVFYLLWSKAAQQSEWVEKEWRIARRLGKIICPVPLDQPRKLPPPPDELADLPFNDLYLAPPDLLSAAE